MCSALAHVCFEPKADSCSAAKTALLFDHLVRAPEHVFAKLVRRAGLWHRGHLSRRQPAPLSQRLLGIQHSVQFRLRLQSRSQRENGELGARCGCRSVEVCAAAHFILLHLRDESVVFQTQPSRELQLCQPSRFPQLLQPEAGPAPLVLEARRFIITKLSYLTLSFT